MKYALIISVIFLAGIAFAQTVDTAIVTTDKTSVDMLVAKAAGDKNGIPVFTLPGGELDDDVKASLQATGAKTIIIVGGPAVVSAAAESQLKSGGYNVIRLWGIERTGTSVEVAKHFWITGSRCAVLVEDTKNPEADTQDEILASSHASNMECPLIPVPKGEMPSEVLALLESMNVSEVDHIGILSAEQKSMLTKYTVRELRDTDIDSEAIRYYTNGTKVIIIAAKTWKDAAGISSYHDNGAAVKFVTDVSQLEPIILFIKSNYIKDVRITGIPALAEEINVALRAEGIVPAKTSGEKASEIAKKVWETNREEWKERRDNYIERRNEAKEKIKARLLERLNETENEIDEESLDADSLAAGGNVSSLRSELQDARAKLMGIKQDIIAGDVEIAQRKMQEIRDYRGVKWRIKDAIKWNWQSDADIEEHGVPNMKGLYESTLNQVSNVLPKLKEKCNSSGIESIVQEATVLKDSIKTALDAKDYPKAATLLEQQHKLVNNAKSLSDICGREEKVTETAKRAAERSVERSEKARKRIEKNDK